MESSQCIRTSIDWRQEYTALETSTPAIAERGIEVTIDPPFGDDEDTLFLYDDWIAK